MRALKFRAWDGDAMVYSDDLNSLEVFFAKFDDDYDKSPRMQFTGMKDKNDTEIYEGDLVLSEDFDEAQEVSFLNGSWLVNTPGIGDWEPLVDCAKNRTPSHSEYDGRWMSDTVMVLGNIYEGVGDIQPTK